jgi:uncharacterized protein (DUF58 family)
MSVQRFIDPAVLSGISGLDLIAKTVVDGFIAGLHRSPNFGFSQEFAEYRAYTAGDDLRHIDWNVYARTERAYLKRYRGETNTLLTILLDSSNSMKYSSHGVSKSEYSRFTAAALFYLTTQTQRDAAGLIVFDDEVRNYIRPSNRQGQFHRLLSGLEQAEPGAKTDFGKALERFLEVFRKRGVVIVISDFYEAPERIIRALEPLRFRGNEVLLFHVLDPAEVRPQFRGPTTLIEMETQESLEVSPDYARLEYTKKIDAHIESLRDGARGSGMDYFLLVTDRPLDGGLREYLAVRQGKW